MYTRQWPRPVEAKTCSSLIPHTETSQTQTQLKFINTLTLVNWHPQCLQLSLAAMSELTQKRIIFQVICQTYFHWVQISHNEKMKLRISHEYKEHFVRNLKLQLDGDQDTFHIKLFFVRMWSSSDHLQIRTIQRLRTKWPLNINLKVVSQNIKLSITITLNEYDCATNSRKGICNTRIEINAFGTSTLPVPTARRQLFVTLLCSEIPAAINNNLLLVKTSADYIITKLLDSMDVNFSQSEQSVGTRFNFYV